VHSGREMSVHNFHAWVRPVWFHQKRVGTHYMDLVFLHLMGYVGHVVRSSSSDA
jgi:hypothetical protein